MNDELDAELWSSQDASAEFDTFTDDVGNTIRELRGPEPLRSLRNRGPTVYNSSQLDRHTGTQTWAVKGDDVESQTLFDTDRLRPVEAFAMDHRRRSNVQLNLNRTDTQREPLREDFEARDTQLYSGYNPVRPQQMRHFVPTRRGVQEVSVVGVERRLEHRAAVASDHEDPLKAGAHRKVSDETRGRVSRWEERAGRGTLLKLGEWTGLQSLDPNDRVSAQTARSAVRGGATLSQTDSVLSKIANRVTSHDHPWKQVEERADVTLSSHDSQPGGDSRATRSDARRSALAAEDTVLGSHDSVEARDPRRSTFSDAARVAADLVLGVQDSKPRSGTAIVGRRNVLVRAMASDVTPTRRIGPAPGQGGGWHNYEGEHRRVLESARARDSAADSQNVERIVADAMERRNSVAAQHSRRLRDDPAAGRVGPSSHSDAAVLPREEVRLGGSDATRLEQERRDRIERHARRSDASNARPWSTSSTIPVVPVARDSVDVTLPPVESQPQRRWRDGGVVSARQEPLSAGPSRGLVTGETSERVPRRSVAANPGRAMHPHLRGDAPSLYLSPESLRA